MYPGLSPLARGTPDVRYTLAPGIRFIPAGAGNTEIVAIYHRLRAVYPRWRGEHATSNLTEKFRGGLSPLARGTPLVNRKRLFQRRFIPAGAGNTQKVTCLYLNKSVYPRWRGEHRTFYRFDGRVSGLSPLARGTPGSNPEGSD